MPVAQVAGHGLDHRRRGAGEAYLLIQGLSGTQASWGEPFLAALEPGLELITYDHRGIGASSPIRGPFSIADLADDAAGLLDALEIEQAHVLGISMGGMVAQELALRHPGRLRSLALGCTYAGGPAGTITDPAVITRLLDAMRSGDRERQLRTSFEINVAPSFAAVPGTYEAFRAMALSVPAPAPVVFEQLRATASHDTSERLREIDVRTLVVHGTADMMLVSANGEAIAEAIPGARLELLPGVGHLFWWEQPERSAALLRAHALARSSRERPAEAQ
jgi:pimeloyl-ACP methyl ester carboxylesterase